MADVKELMLDVVVKNPTIQSEEYDETEELIDTGLEITEDNLKAVAIAYLDDKGYRRRTDNIEMAKQRILEASKGYDTIIVKMNRVEENSIFAKATKEELRDLLNVCLNNTLEAVHKKIDRLVNKQYEYHVEYVNELKKESSRPKRGRLGEEEFETFEQLLNRNAKAGWEIDKMFDYSDDEICLVFRREIVS